MNDAQIFTAKDCLNAAETDAEAFPQIVGRLINAGFESYTVDFRRATVIYHLPSGESLELSGHPIRGPIAEKFDAPALQAAIREAQQQVAGYSYKGFCEKAAAAGCVSYFVSFLGRRALYSGHSGETHTEHFPN